MTVRLLLMRADQRSVILTPCRWWQPSALELETKVAEVYAKFYNDNHKAANRTFSWLKAPTSAFTFKTHL